MVVLFVGVHVRALLGTIPEMLLRRFKMLRLRRHLLEQFTLLHSPGIASGAAGEPSFRDFLGSVEGSSVIPPAATCSHPYVPEVNQTGKDRKGVLILT